MQIDPQPSQAWEGAFWLDEFLKLRLPPNVGHRAVYGFLTCQVRRWPRKFQFHVLRIRTALLVDGEVLYAALLDLFLTLEKGQALKQRMLRWARKRLAFTRLAALEECLAGRLNARQLPFSPRSVLHDGMWGQAVDLSAFEATDRSKDPIAVARLCLEAGQLEHAREILVSQLQVEPERAEARQELLDIYRATQDAEGFWQSYRWLEANRCLDEAWQAAGAWFVQNVS